MRRREFLGLVGTAAPRGRSPPRATAGDAGDRISRSHLTGGKSRSNAWLSPRAERQRFHRRRECRHRIPLGREPAGSVARAGCRSGAPPCCADRGGFSTGRICGQGGSSRIPIVFGMAQDPVKLGLVASVARPGGNLTGVNFLATELAAKRLELLRELVPGATRVAAIVSLLTRRPRQATSKRRPEPSGCKSSFSPSKAVATSIWPSRTLRKHGRMRCSSAAALF